MIQTNDVVRVNEKNHFAAGQRIIATDVQAQPPVYHAGVISSVWSDATAIIDWDDNRLHLNRDRHLVHSGRVDLHHLTRQ